MKIRVIYFVMLFLCVAAAQSEPVLKGGPEELKSYLLKENYRTISIRGDAEKYIPVEKPEIAILVKTEDYEFKRALEKNKKVRGAVRER
ncbi:MAG: hypothetical protein OEZ47_16985, partial [Gammaproteobacteria bacterium]|nr:hypothetical protein [Gammaproteobacteria bacterium]